MSEEHDLPIGEIPKDFVKDYKEHAADVTDKEMFALHYGWGQGTRDAYDKATLAEHDRWANQPANEHDERIRLAERNRILNALPPIRHKITGEYKDRRASGFNECRKLVIKIITDE